LEEIAMTRVGLKVGALAGLLCMAPTPPLIHADAETAKAELLALHQVDRRAHFHHDVDALVASLPTEFIYVRDGKIQAQTKEDLRERFTEYFQGAEFSAWNDLEPAIIHASPDGLMGWMVVRVKVAYSKTGAAGKKTKEQSVMAWISVYEKHEGKWLHVANASTFEPE
jgi:hypothetical protein